MAKNKDGGSGKGGIKIPKQVAGIKIPKSLRASGKSVIEMAQNPATRQLLVAGLAAAATAVATAQTRKNAARGGRQASDADGSGSSPASQGAGDVGAALVGAFSAVAARFFGQEPGVGVGPGPSLRTAEEHIPSTPVPQDTRPSPAPVSQEKERVVVRKPRINGATPSALSAGSTTKAESRKSRPAGEL